MNYGRAFIPNKGFKYYINASLKLETFFDSQFVLHTDPDAALGREKETRTRHNYYWRKKQNTTTNGENLPLYEIFK